VRRQHLSEDVIRQAHTVQIHALARLGDLLKVLEPRGPKHSRGGGRNGSKREPLPSAPTADRAVYRPECSTRSADRRHVVRASLRIAKALVRAWGI
jgi:hypothetical protein